MQVQVHQCLEQQLPAWRARARTGQDCALESSDAAWVWAWRRLTHIPGLKEQSSPLAQASRCQGLCLLVPTFCFLSLSSASRPTANQSAPVLTTHTCLKSSAEGLSHSGPHAAILAQSQKRGGVNLHPRILQP